MFRKIGLKGKIVGLCALLSLFVMASGLVSWLSMKRVVADYDHIAEINLNNVELLGTMYSQFWRARSEVRTFGLMGVTPEVAEKARRNIADALAAYEEANKKYLAIPFVEGEDELYQPMDKTWKNYQIVNQHAVDTFKREGTQAQAKLQEFFFKTAPTLAREYDEAINKLIVFQMQEAKKWGKAADSTAEWSDRIMLVVTLASFIAALALGWVFSSNLSHLLAGIAQKLSAGADEVASAASQISSTSEALSSASTEQASSLQETASSVEEMSAMIKKNADNATKSREISTGSQSAATKGKHVVSEMIGSIQEIDHANAEIMKAIEDSNREIGDIVKVISEIGNKTKVINDIVFQTKLLSFNASVEAARAGEHGKGFAVVAEEVGNLAHMSGNAAKEISSMLDGSIKKVESVASGTKTRVERLVELGKAKVAVGQEVARRCGEVLDDIVASSTSVSHSISEIAAASQEQTQGVHEINKAMHQLNQVTQQNAASSQEAASAATELAAQAETFRNAVQALLRAIHGNQSGGSGVETVVSDHKAPQRKGSEPSHSDPRFKSEAPRSAA